MPVKVLILEDNPVARSFLCRVVRESFSDAITITEAGDLESARRHIAISPSPACGVALCEARSGVPQPSSCTRSQSHSASRDLPIPGSPLSNTTWPRPSLTCSQRSRSRPTS